MATVKLAGRFNRQSEIKSGVNGKTHLGKITGNSTGIAAGIVAAVITGIALTATLLSPPASADNPRITEYGDWRAVCKSQCVIAQGLQNPDNPGIIYSSQVSYVSNQTEPVMQLNLPLGIYLPPGIAIGIGEQQHSAPVAVCLPGGCKVLLVLTPDIVQQMHNSAAYTVQLFVSEQTPRQLKFSLRGFTEALASLAADNNSQQ